MSSLLPTDRAGEYWAARPVVAAARRRVTARIARRKKAWSLRSLTIASGRLTRLRNDQPSVRGVSTSEGGCMKHLNLELEKLEELIRVGHQAPGVTRAPGGIP